MVFENCSAEIDRGGELAVAVACRLCGYVLFLCECSFRRAFY